MNPRNLTIIVTVEPSALGAIILKLGEMPGVVGVNLAVSNSKAGNTSPPIEAEGTHNDEVIGLSTTDHSRLLLSSREDVAVTLLSKGPAGMTELEQALADAGLGSGIEKAYNLVSRLKKKGMVKRVGKSVVLLSADPRPTPRKASSKLKPKNPASKELLLETLANGPLTLVDLKKKLAERRVSSQAVSTAKYRALKQDLIRSVGNGTFELTAIGLDKCRGGSVRVDHA